LGICLAAIYQWRKTLLAPIFVHSLFNAMQMIGLLIMMSANANAPMIGVVSEKHADGLRVTVVSENSGAEEAGIQVGDIITEIDGRPVTSRKDLFEITRKCKVGDMVKLKLIRDKTPMNKSVVLGSRDKRNKPTEKP
jgi:S1-C subfamily serine protease